MNKFYHGLRLSKADMDRRVRLEMQEGDTVFFHPLLIHGSGTNRTQGFRKAISCHYASSQCAFIDVAGSPQETLAIETVSVVARKQGWPVDNMSKKDMMQLFNAGWANKSRLVAGREGTL